MSEIDTGQQSTDVAIVGGGVIGVACAYELGRRGTAVPIVWDNEADFAPEFLYQAIKVTA